MGGGSRWLDGVGKSWPNGAMPASPDDLFAYLDRLGIAHSTVWHEAMFTVEQSSALKADMPGAHTKNLFLKDKDGQLILIAAEAHGPIRLNQLHKLIGTARLSFGAPELMTEVLGVVPGSVTAFALMNDGAGRVRFLVDAVLAGAEWWRRPVTRPGNSACARQCHR